VPASIRAGRPWNTEATALPPGGHPIRIVVADDKRFVEHLGNAGRPHAATGPYRVCTGPRVGQGRTSSLRCGRSTLTNTSGPEPSRSLCRVPYHAGHQVRLRLRTDLPLGVRGALSPQGRQGALAAGTRVRGEGSAAIGLCEPRGGAARGDRSPIMRVIL
jgi:hypothetical protein